MGPYELRILAKSGDWLVGEFVSVPQLEGGRVVGELGIARDITERKRIEEALKESEKRYRVLTQSAMDAIVSCDGSGRIFSWNKGAQLIFGYSEDEILGESIFKLAPDAKRESYRQFLREQVLSDQPSIFGMLVEGYGRRKDGSEFPLEMSASAWEMGGETYYTGIIRDVTDRKRLEREIKARNRELSAYAHTISHDLRSPLAAIDGYAQLIQRARSEGREEVVEECVEAIRRLSLRSIGLINALLEYAEVGETGGEVIPIEMEKVVEDVLAEYQEEICSRGARVVVEGEMPKVLLDPARLHQVFSNLLGNALKFMDRSTEPQVTIGARREGEERTIVYVQDNGIGIDPLACEEIFKPFKRLGDQELPGWGIGLSIVKKVVESWGGEIWVESVPGEGSTFYFTLPPMA